MRNKTRTQSPELRLIGTEPIVINRSRGVAGEPGVATRRCMWTEQKEKLQRKQREWAQGTQKHSGEISDVAQQPMKDTRSEKPTNDDPA